ncbi:MAG TPA: cytidylate kinase family protein [Acidimicrobiales bacterium]|nr:cytidylate kinase family protein [Acidimicrobiales bacterium]
MLVTVSGPPGSGTTTTSTLVAARLGVDILPGGAVFRAMAHERGMSLAAFGAYAAEHPEVDVELDARLAKRARAGGVLIESRLAGWIARHEGLDAVTTYLECPPGVRAARVAEREGIDVARAVADNAERERVERRRYLALYGIDIEDRSVYDLVLDSRARRPPELADQIAAAARARFG